MRSWRQVLAVAVWEFRRFYKLRDQILSLLLAILGGAVGFGVQWFVGKSTGEVRVAVLHGDRLPALNLSRESRLRLDARGDTDETALRTAVGRRELDGVLLVDGPDRAELVVAKEPVWKQELLDALNDARRRVKLAAADIDPKTLADAFTPMELAVAYHEAGRSASSAAEKVVAGVFVGLTCLGVFLGMASFFAGITGEKQLRVTEQVVAAISPQTWVDGKLLGLTGAAFGTILTYGAALALCLAILWLGGMSFTMPWAAVRPTNLLVFLLLSVLGIFFWNCVFAAIAVTINDPNSSTRSSLMFLPLTFVAMGFPGLRTPDAPVMRALSVLPGTSSTVMSARLVLSDVAAWEVALALLLLILMTLVFRRLAGKVFTAGILMTGQEPTWGELWRALRRA